MISFPRYFFLILALKELSSLYTEGLLLFLSFLEGSRAAAKRCDQFVVEWNPNFSYFLCPEAKIQDFCSERYLRGNYFPWELWGCLWEIVYTFLRIQIEGSRNQNSTVLKK